MQTVFSSGQAQVACPFFCMRGVTLLLAYAGDWDKSLFVKVISAALCVLCVEMAF